MCVCVPLSLDDDGVVVVVVVAVVDDGDGAVAAADGEEQGARVERDAVDRADALPEEPVLVPQRVHGRPRQGPDLMAGPVISTRQVGMRG